MPRHLKAVRNTLTPPPSTRAKSTLIDSTWQRRISTHEILTIPSTSYRTQNGTFSTSGPGLGHTPFLGGGGGLLTSPAATASKHGSGRFAPRVAAKRPEPARAPVCTPVRPAPGPLKSAPKSAPCYPPTALVTHPPACLATSSARAGVRARAPTRAGHLLLRWATRPPALWPTYLAAAQKVRLPTRPLADRPASQPAVVADQPRAQPGRSPTRTRAIAIALAYTCACACHRLARFCHRFCHRPARF